jgi:hypothetical protein
MAKPKALNDKQVKSIRKKLAQKKPPRVAVLAWENDVTTGVIYDVKHQRGAYSQA